MFAVRDEHAALDVVQDAMLKLTEKYAAKPIGELPMLFQRILQNTIHDHFRRQKVRSTWTSLLSALGKRDEKDDDFDPLETLAAKSDSNATVDPAVQFEQAQVMTIIEAGAGAVAGTSTRSLSPALLGRVRCGGNRRGDGVFRGQRQDALFASRPCTGRNAQGQGCNAMTSQDNEFAKKLTSYLDDGAANLKAGTAYRLQLARAEALARLGDPQRAPATRMSAALAGAGSGTVGGGPGLRMNAKLLVGALLVVVAYFGYNQWQAYQQLTDLQETDAALLSSDLPIDAYLDRGFQNWLMSTTDSAD